MILPAWLIVIGALSLIANILGIIVVIIIAVNGLKENVYVDDNTIAGLDYYCSRCRSVFRA